MAQSEYLIESNDKTFGDDVIIKSDDIPVLVDFWAPWCGPCRMLAPVLDQLADHFDGKLRIVKVNTDESPGASRHFGIRSIPAMKLFKGREVVFETGGVQPLQQLIQALTPFVEESDTSEVSIKEKPAMNVTVSFNH